MSSYSKKYFLKNKKLYNEELLTFQKKNKTTLTKYFIIKNYFAFFKTLFHLNTQKYITKSINNPQKHSNTSKLLLWSFKRNKFFPTLLSLTGHTYTTLSLGTFFNFFLKPKSFKKSKQLYILLISFLRKLIIYSNITSIVLRVKFIPRFFPELINLFTNKSLTTYQNPFSQLIINEKPNQTPQITNIVFTNTKPYGIFKKRKKGVVKRKVLRKVYKNNNIID